MRPLIAALAALSFAPAAAAATPIYWTPAHMTKALVTLSYPHQGVLSGVCHGVAKPKRGAFTGFRCMMTWQVVGNDGNPTADGKNTVWARPLPAGRVCGSTVSLSTCAPLKAGPLAGDPTVCDANDPNRCVVANGLLAMRRHVGGPGGMYQGTTSCTLSSMAAALVKLDCLAGTTAEAVVFTKGVSQWTATVTP